MDYRKIRAVFFIIVFLLALALIVHWAVGADDSRRAARMEEEAEATEEATPPLVHETPSPTQPPAQQRPTAPTPKPSTPTQAPAPTQKPAQQPAPTPIPTPAPAPAGKDLGSGTFSSETGTGLDLLCEWRAVSVEGNKAEVTLTIGVRSASLYLNEWIDCIGLRVGDRTATMTQPGLDYTGGTTSHTFGSRTFTVDLSGGSSFPVAVEWHYNGDYGGTHIDVLECGGTITLN